MYWASTDEYLEPLMYNLIPRGFLPFDGTIRFTENLKKV